MEKKEKPGLLQKLAENDTYRKWILAIGLIGMALIFLSGFFKNGEKAVSANAVPQPVAESSVDGYTEQVQASLKDIVSSIDGVGSCKILVTLEKSAQYVYATEEKKSKQTTQDQAANATVKNEDSSETKYIIVKDKDGSQKALAVTEVQPTVKGVVVVCEGGNQPGVQQNIINAVTTALNISSARVCVVSGNSADQ